jgi:hypothetical protein
MPGRRLAEPGQRDGRVPAARGGTAARGGAAGRAGGGRGAVQKNGGRQHHLRRDSGKQVASLIGVSVLAVAVLLGFVLLRVYRQHQQPDHAPAQGAAPAVAVGGCVARPGQDLLQPVACSDARAFARVVAAVPDQTGSECPVETDDIARPGGSLLCLVSLRAPHPGTPGLGGGVIRSGDCIANPGSGTTMERPCAQSGVYATVLARVDRLEQCATPAAESVRLQVGAHPVACLRSRAKVGDCLAAGRTGTPEVVLCTSRAATGKLLGRAANGAGCPVGTINRITARNGLPAARVICLAAPR